VSILIGTRIMELLVIAKNISLMINEMGIFHYCHVSNNEKSHVTVTCLQFRSRAVSATTPHKPKDPTYTKYVTPGLGLIIIRICNSTVWMM